MRIVGFPRDVGAIDGTHVRITAPTVDEETYMNRKGFHNINVQVVFDAKYKILDLVFCFDFYKILSALASVFASIT